MVEPTSRSFATVEEGIAAIRRGDLVIVVDSEDRENEGDLVMAADHATAASVNFMMTHGRGLICVPMLADRLGELGIPPMVAHNTDLHGTAFHVGVDYRVAGSTGISASDRARTARALADPDSSPAEFSQPGHVFPLAYRPGGVLRRAGHTEASVDLARLAGRAPAAVICEIARADGEMARLFELLELADRHDLPIIAISDLAAWRRRREQLVRRESEARLPLAEGEFTVIGYRDLLDGHEHVAIVFGDVTGRDDVLVRIHSECLTGDVFGSRRCDCGLQLRAALSMIAREGAGAVVYLRGHEGRGIGLVNKISAYGLQDRGFDTVEANRELGFAADGRDYTIGTQILHDLGIGRVRLLTNNPRKRSSLERNGVGVTACVPIVCEPTAESVRYLATKRLKLGHALPPMLSGVKDAATAGLGRRSAAQ